MAENHAAYLMSPKARPFVIKPVPKGVPESGQILVRNRAVAINPINGKIQKLAIYPIQYPAILGEDVAGEVVEVGPDVTQFTVGDRALGFAAGFGTKIPAEEAFQEYTILRANLACVIPDTIPFERAVVLPLSVATAASGLFNPDFLNLQLPTQPARPKNGKTVLVWGAASSVGNSAVQLAVAAGYEVIATASAKNFDRVRSLGASDIFDYNSTSTVQALVMACKNKDMVGAFDAVGGAAWQPTAEVINRSSGRKFVATTIPGFPDPPEGMDMRQVQAFSIKDNGVADAIFRDFLPHALKAGTFVTAPEPFVAGSSLHDLQAAVDLQLQGISGKKVVVTL